jgi:molecular chaperone GrpE
MKRQRFPFIINAFQRRPAEAHSVDASLNDLATKLLRVLTSLGLIESSLEELSAKADDSATWRRFYGQLVPIVDGIDSLEAAMGQASDPSWKQGTTILSGKLEALLEAYGLQRTAHVGMTFDPARHQSVGAIESSGMMPGVVAEVVQSGWLFRGEIIRYAKVVVARGDC